MLLDLFSSPSMTYYPSHLQSVFPDPRIFNPDRFLLNGQLNADVPNPAIMTFGYGKRSASFRIGIFHSLDANCICSMCPGRHIALRTLWGTIAAVLSLYDIGPSLNEDGTPHIPSGEFTTGLLRRVSIPPTFFFFSSARHRLEFDCN